MTIFENLRTPLPRKLLLPSAFSLLPSGGVAADAFDAASFAELPVQVGGRVQPVDTLARNSLLLLRGTQTVSFSKTEAEFFSEKPSAWTPAQKAAFRAEGLPADD